MKKVCVMLSAYNGEKYLPRQLDTLAAQTGVDMRLYVRDDGSKDSTSRILREYRDRGVIDKIIEDGKGNLGFADSFYTLVREADPDCDYYAFCDQDDEWDPDKLAAACSVLDGADASRPALCFGRYRVIDRNGKVKQKKGLKFYRFFPEYAFEELFSMNFTYGCTCVFNAKAREYYLRYEIGEIRFHDWTINVICTGLGSVYFDPQPHMSYRLHESNCFGPISLSKKALRRFRNYWKNYEMNNTRLKEMLLFKKHFYGELTDERREFVDMICGYREDPALKKKLLSSKRYFHKGKKGWLSILNRYQIRKGKL